METTFEEILEMRRKLDKALSEKVGYEVVSGFDIRVSCWDDSCVSFCQAYTKEFGSEFRVEGEAKSTPQEAFDSAMSAIDAHKEPTKKDRIESLRRERAALTDD